ncbi:GDSL esterase/lipase-like [Dorcoceras hygrometricum]|uniref:GDSL esterase/lipase-like n=1 Tax=Dorcoceras hygrometricum TaxID=472368 RepID=A0A2Z7AFS1_9LAMI|nr:GDSL esterase/lipase-like [Dorcoceras hygrometricum]
MSMPKDVYIVSIRTSNLNSTSTDHAKYSSNSLLKSATHQLLRSSDRKCLQARIYQDIYKSAFTKAHLAYSSKLRSLTQLLQIHRALSCSKSRLKTLRKAYPKALTYRKNRRSEIDEDARTCNYFALPQHVGSKAPNRNKSKELSKTNPAPPISLQTTHLNPSIYATVKVYTDYSNLIGNPDLSAKAKVPQIWPQSYGFATLNKRYKSKRRRLRFRLNNAKQRRAASNLKQSHALRPS